MARPFQSVFLLLALLSTLAAQTYNGYLRTSLGPGKHQDPANVALGKKLFFDPRLSADGSLACAGCHVPAHAFADSRAISVGIHGQVGGRRVPSLIGRGSGARQFWDGRAATLEEQVLLPIQDPREMGMQLDAALARLQSDPAYSGLTQQSLAQALASYVRTIRSVDTPFDRFIAGDTAALSDMEREGLRLFRDKARCYVCHAGDSLTDEAFHNTGVAWQAGVFRDEGRGAITGKPYDRGAFKTPTLREIALTAPYMHDGSVATLEEVIEYYDRGGNPNPSLDDNLTPLHLSAEEKRALAAFLRALSGTIKDGL